MRFRWVAFGSLLAIAGTQISAQDAASQAIDAAGSTASIAAEMDDIRPPIIPTSAFAAQGNFRSAILSPDGNTVAIQMELAGQPTIVLFDSETKKPVERFNIGEKVGLEWFSWASNERLLVSVSKSGDYFGTESLFTRLYVADRTTNDFRFIGTKEPILTGDDVIYTAPDGSHVLLTMQANPYETPSVFRFDLDKSERGKRIEKPRDDIWNFFADSNGVVRVGTGWSNERLRVYYRRAEGEKMELVGRFQAGETDAELWDVAYIRPGSDIGYVIDRGSTGRTELQSFDFAKREKVETVYVNPDWDIESATISKEGEPIATFFTDDRSRVVWFDEGDKALQRSLDKVLKEDEAWISSRARDGSRMLVAAGGEADPGALYIYTPAEKRLDMFSEIRPQVQFGNLAKPKPVHYEARDGTKITAYLTLPRGRGTQKLPLILLPHGGPYGVRDQLRYDDEVQLLANRGYAVLQPNYRGSSGYGLKFSRLGTGQIGRKMQDDIDDAMDWAVAEGIADPNRVCVVGGSYGGYAALWAVVRNPDRYRCAASWAGVTDWDSQLKYDRNYFTRKGGKKWRNRVEGDEDGFDLDNVSPYRQAEKLTRPTLLAHGTEDNNVPFSQFKKMRDAAEKVSAPVELLVIDGEGHSFSKPENEQKWFDTLVAFLARHNPAD